jgi:hypothetical protein
MRPFRTRFQSCRTRPARHQPAPSPLRLRMRHTRARSGGRGGQARREEHGAAGAGGAGHAWNGLAQSQPDGGSTAAPRASGWPTAPANAIHAGALGRARRPSAAGRALGRGRHRGWRSKTARRRPRPMCLRLRPATAPAHAPHASALRAGAAARRGGSCAGTRTTEGPTRRRTAGAAEAPLAPRWEAGCGRPTVPANCDPRVVRSGERGGQAQPEERAGAADPGGAGGARRTAPPRWHRPRRAAFALALCALEPSLVRPPLRRDVAHEIFQKSGRKRRIPFLRAICNLYCRPDCFLTPP